MLKEICMQKENSTTQKCVSKHTLTQRTQSAMVSVANYTFKNYIKNNCKWTLEKHYGVYKR